MMEEPVFNIKKCDGDYVVWISHLGVLTTAADLDTALKTADADARRVIESFERAGVAPPRQLFEGGLSLPIPSLIKANMASFALKSVIVTAMLVVVMLIGSRMLPMRGLSDFAAYARLAPPERVAKMIDDARELGRVTRPVLGEIGLGCSCVREE